MAPAATETVTTTGIFRHIDPASFGADNPKAVSAKPWSKVDGGGVSYEVTEHPRTVTDIRPNISSYTTDNVGFSVHSWPTTLEADDFFNADDGKVRGPYYDEIEALLKDKLDNVAKVVIFDHTIRRRRPDSPRQPVQLVHVDQTPQAAENRVRRHLPEEEAEELLKSGVRYQIINVWRPIGYPAVDFPLAVVDWRSTSKTDFVPVDLLYPHGYTRPTVAPAAKSNGVHNHGDDDRGKEALPLKVDKHSTEGYFAKGETYGVQANDRHKFFYVKGMRPDETMFIKCFDSWGQELPGGKEGIAMCTPHTAFLDPDTPEGEKGRQSIEVRTLVFYKD